MGEGGVAGAILGKREGWDGEVGREVRSGVSSLRVDLLSFFWKSRKKFDGIADFVYFCKLKRHPLYRRPRKGGRRKVRAAQSRHTS